MNGKVMPVRIVPMKTEHLDAVAELERSCFTVPWSRNALAEGAGQRALGLSSSRWTKMTAWSAMRACRLCSTRAISPMSPCGPTAAAAASRGSCSMSSSALPRQSSRVSLTRGAREQLRRYRALRAARLPRRGTPQELL